MWIIENKDFFKGGFVEWGEPYQLKHFTTGMYLSIKRVVKGLITKYTLEMVSKSNPGTWFIFEKVS